jgi:hypothetical protein
MSPTALSLSLLRAQGYLAEVTERFVRIPVKEGDGNEAHIAVSNCPPDIAFRKDLFGCIDILAIKKGQTLAVQTTSIGNISARVKKIQSLVEFEWMKQAGWQVHVHGWKLEKGGGVRVINMTTMETLWSSILRKPKRGKKARAQRALPL